jgi:hypothetical protein
MTFLPEGTEIPSSTSNYMKLSESENKFRVLGSAITGYELWIGGKPIRRKENKWTVEEFDNSDINKFTGEKKIPQYFWAFPVWNYQTEHVEILEVTQKAVLKGMQSYLNDEDYGSDPKKYDFVVVREDTKPITYSVKAKPPKEIDPGITQLYQDMNIDLDQLYTGGNPFKKEIDTAKVAEEVFEGLGKKGDPRYQFKK